MSWTTPRVWISGELVSASIGNTHWRDNLAYLYDSMGVFSTRVRYDIAISPTISAQQDNWNPSGLATCSWIRVTASGGPQVISGILAQPHGTFYWMTALPGSAEVTLQHLSSNSLAANQLFLTPAATLALTQYESLGIMYDGTSAVWRVMVSTHV